jgi:class 3 adenylate cyclase
MESKSRRQFSTGLVDDYTPEFAAEVYKTYLHCAVKIIRDNGGSIVSFDGDRVMAVFYGNSKNTSAVKSALQINYAVRKIINPAIKAQYPNVSYEMAAACGVDTGNIMVARTGIRSNNDLVWIGRPANYAAKLCALRKSGYSTWITKEVFSNVDKSVLYGGSPEQIMWESYAWQKYNVTVYRSSWWWKP